jgi:hypothetical protein
MKTNQKYRLLILSVLFFEMIKVHAQDEFGKRLSEARAAFAANKLGDTRFAMQQMMQEIDINIGKSILKSLPLKVESWSVNIANDHVSGASGFFGVVVHRDYGTIDSTGTPFSVEVINNSPVLVGLNALLSLPVMVNGDIRKVVKIAGYKALIEPSSTEFGPTGGHYIQISIGSTLITLNLNKGSMEQVQKIAESMPIAEIAKLSQ